MKTKISRNPKLTFTVLLCVGFPCLFLFAKPHVTNALVGSGEKIGNGKPIPSIALRRPPLTNKKTFTRRVGQVNKEVCGKNSGCVRTLKKEQKRRGGNCRVNGNAKACDKLSDGRIISTEKGIGSKGKTGGKALSKKTIGGSLAAITIGGILLNTKDQQSDPDYLDGERTYQIQVVGRSKSNKGTVPLKGVRVDFKVHAERGEKNGCRHSGSGPREGLFSSNLTDKTNGEGLVAFFDCSHQQISISLKDIPKGYKTVEKQANGAAVTIRSPLEDPNRHEDTGRITITLEELEPKKDKNKKCSEESQKLLGKEKDPTGSDGNSGGNNVTYRGNSRSVKINNIMGKTDQLNFRDGISKECQEKISHSRTYVVRAWTVTHPREKGKDIKKITQSFPVELKFSGPGSCKTPNPQRSGGDSKVTFKGCSRNQIDLEIEAPSSHPVVFKYKNKGGYVRVLGHSSNTGTIVNIDVYFENELQPYTSAQKAKFAAAANKYWSSIPRNVGPMHISQARCKPSEVEYFYEPKSYFKDKNYAVAAAGQFGAQLSKCRVTWNKSGERISDNSNLQHACISFVHEYGHLLGYEHSSNPKYMMYSFPNWRDPTLLRASGC